MPESVDKPKSFLRWAGSKRQLLPLLLKYWPAGCGRYIEPFAGSACLFFEIQPETAILGDINKQLVDTYKEIKHHLDGVIKELAKLKKGKKEYYYLRNIDPVCLNPSERAARFIYLNRYCFNGLYRTNRNGRFNVPYGGHKAGNIPSNNTLEACRKVLQNAELIDGDFEQIIQECCKGDFVYMDPPYSVKSYRVFNEYNASVFTNTDLKRLRHWLNKLTEIGVVFVLSYAFSDEAKFLTDGYHFEIVSIRRNIAGFAGKRRNTKEVIISNKKILM